MVRALFAILLLPMLTLGQEKKEETRWQEQAQKILKPAQVEVLTAQKFVVSEESYKQVFTPYLYGGMPVFVTSDSLLNAFHILLEESIYQMEKANAARLPAFLEYTARQIDGACENLDVEPALLSAAKLRAKIFLGTALRLNKDGTGTFDEDTAKRIKEEVARITAAREVSKPAWLGPPDRGFLAIDYTRFQPRGFYTRSAELERYFRLISWLQAVPFRVEKDEELLAALLLSRAAVISDKPEFETARTGSKVLNGFREFLGGYDDWSLAALNSFHKDIEKGSRNDTKERNRLVTIRAELLKRAKEDRPAINDQIAFIPEDPKAVAEVSIRMAPAYRLPDAVLFQRTTDPRKVKREWPSGLDVAVALGSPHARTSLTKSEGAALVTLIDANNKLLRTSWRDSLELTFESLNRPSLYMDYLKCLRTLTETKEPDWPEFMKSEAWKAKTSQTILAGWAQMRHTWVLQAKLNIRWLSESRKPTGFVEPVPEFYREFGQLCERFESVLNDAGAFAITKKAGEDKWFKEYRAGKLVDLDRLIDSLEEAQVLKKGAEGLKGLSDDDRIEAQKYAEQVRNEGLKGLETPEQFREFLVTVRQQQEKISRELDDSDVDLAPRWKELQECCARLECLSHKQLRGREFALDEQRFLGQYGRSLARIMMYDGNSYQTPRDDAPRIVDVFANKGQILEVGIGKPRAMYVLYPWHGSEILCRGAVLPYYEFVDKERLTDTAWRDLLQTEARPAQPAWTKVLTNGSPR